MYGAILGDIIGSPYEFDSNAIKTKDFPLFSEKSEFTDDTVMTAAIAQAIMEEQTIIILDEPYNALDYKTNHEITEILERLKQEGKTILLTSHQHEYLEKLCDVIYCIYENKIIPFTDEYKGIYFGL